MSKQFPRRKKLALLGSCILLGVAAYFPAYAYFSRDLTDWQKNQKIDFDKQTGATKFKAIIDSVSVGAATFCLGAITIITIARLRTLRKK